MIYPSSSVDDLVIRMRHHVLVVSLSPSLLHLSEPDPPGPAPALHWLVGQDVNGSCGSNLELVRHHMPQALVVDHTHKYISLKFPAIYTTVETLVAEVVVASCVCVGVCVCVGGSSKTDILTIMYQ